MQELRYDGRVVVVTGAGAGLGRSHALFFAKRGAKVVVNDLGGSKHGSGQSTAAADAVVAEIRAAQGTAIANYDSVENGAAVIQSAIDAFGRIDVLINNAGILRDVSFPKMTKEDWELVIRVHLNGAFACTHAAWPFMRDQGYGRVVFTTSAAGLYGNFGQANYSSAKLGLVGLTKTLAIEGEKRNILCNAIAPIAASRLTETVMPPEMLENLKPEYVTPLVVWLAHESCRENGGVFELGAGFFSQLRWERTQGKVFKLGRQLTPEHVQESWQSIVDFSKVNHPSNITEALTPVMSNLSSKSKGGNELIDVDEALGYEMPEIRSKYDERDVALYALGVGAGRNATEASALRLVYERFGEGFDPLPTYGVIPAINAIFQAISEGKGAKGLNYGLERILHGEQYMEVTRPLPSQGELIHRARVADIFDKGKNAVVVTHIDSFLADTGELLVKNDVSMVIRGAGGWGGDRGPSSEVNVPPNRPADVTVTEKTDERQALVYRLSGDWNPLHVDPEFARMFGFQKPILHGLCTFGFVGRVVIHSFCGGDPRLFRSIKVRFAEPVYPGETLRFEMWKESARRILVRVTIAERDKVCISNAAVELYEAVPQPASRRIESRPATATAGESKVKQAKADDRPASESLSAEGVFDAIGAYVKEHPELVRSVGCEYQFILKDPDSSWVLDLKTGAGSVRAGNAEKPDCTLRLSNSDWLDMVAGAADPMKLFQSGRLKIAGNVMASQKLDFLKKIERKGSSRPETTAAAVSNEPIRVSSKTPDLVAAIKRQLVEQPQVSKEIGAMIAFRIKEGGSFTMDCRATPAVVFDGVDASAAAVVTLSDEAFGRLVAEGAVHTLFQHGELRVDGAMAPIHRLQVLKQLVVG